MLTMKTLTEGPMRHDSIADLSTREAKRIAKAVDQKVYEALRRLGEAYPIEVALSGRMHMVQYAPNGAAIALCATDVMLDGVPIVRISPAANVRGLDDSFFAGPEIRLLVDEQGNHLEA